MSGLMSQGAILTASRFSNFAILVLSPLLMVRILDVDAYGKYQEFMIYASLLVATCGFGVDASLTYFLPRNPEKDREYVSQNTVLVLAFSFCFLSILILFKPLFLNIVTYDFVYPLVAYVFLFVNLNWLEYYWIANKRTDLVLIYSSTRLILRITILLFVAFLTHDITAILWSLVCVEALRIVLVTLYIVKAKLLIFKLNWALTFEQTKFSLPVGLSALLQQASRSIGKLYVGSVLGPASLALYAVASYLLPLVLVIRGSIADVVFPEMVRIAGDPRESIRLWQRSIVVFCVLLFPPFVLLIYYAELIVITLFTEKYLAAVPIFQVYALWLIRRCLNMDVLIRTRGRTGFMLTGTVFSLVTNSALMVLFYIWLGLIGPALAYVVAEILVELYYAYLVRKEFELKVSELLDWKGIVRVAVACIPGLPLLVMAKYAPGPTLLSAAVASILFITLCWTVAYKIGVTDVGKIVHFALARIYKQLGKTTTN